MTTNPDDDLPVTESSAIEAPVRPARRRRAPSGEASASAATDAVSTTEPAAPRRRRKTTASEALPADAPQAEEAGLDAAPAVEASPSAAIVRGEERAEPLDADAAVASQAFGTAAPGDASPQADDAVSSESAEADDATGDERNERGRRGRRDRRRGPRPEVTTEAVMSDEPNAAQQPAANRPPPADPAEVFAQVVAGDFDAQAEPEAASDEEPAKRVLAPDPDAPKLQKVLAQAGVGSRRDMEQLIADGLITVNGEPAHTGQRVSWGDRVMVEGKPIRFRIAPPPPRILAYHKPAGEVVTHDDPQARPTVFRRLPRLPQGKWQSVGRLDINTEGLLLFTNSGDLANQLMHPRFGVEREYAVRVLGTLTEDQREELLDGVEVDGQEARFESIEDGGGEGANHWYRVVITEGRNREVRKLFDALGLTVSRLIRIRYGTVVLPRGLKRGVWVDLDDADVRAIRRLASAGDGSQPARRDAERSGRRRGRDRQRPQERGPAPAPLAGPRHDEDGFEDSELDRGPIPNPLEQTFDRRFVQKGRANFASGFGSPNRHANAPKKGSGPRQPDPMQTSVGYIGADAFHQRKGGRGGGGYGGGGGGGGGGGRGRRGR